jgi:carbamoyl-phosphate synthase large subunit
VIPAIEQDALRMSAEQRHFERTAARFALNAPDLITTAHDKWSMHSRLLEAGVPTIPSAIDGTFDDLAARFGLPFVVKPRRSYASKGFVRVETAEDFLYWRTKLDGEFMAQQLVGDDRDEYTVGAFGLGDGTLTGKTILRRILPRDGSTAKAWLSANPDIDSVVDRLARLFRPVGPTNFQFRRHNGVYLPLEISPRSVRASRRRPRCVRRSARTTPRCASSISSKGGRLPRGACGPALPCGTSKT